MGSLFPSLERFYLHPTDSSGDSIIDVDFSSFPTVVKSVAFSEVTGVREGPPARVSSVRSIRSLYCLEDFYGATGVFDVSDSNTDISWDGEKYHYSDYDDGSGLGGVVDIWERPSMSDAPQCPVETKGFPQVVDFCNNINSPTFCKYADGKPADTSGTVMSCSTSIFDANRCPPPMNWLGCILDPDADRDYACTGQIS